MVKGGHENISELQSTHINGNPPSFSLTLLLDPVVVHFLFSLPGSWLGLRHLLTQDPDTHTHVCAHTYTRTLFPVYIHTNIQFRTHRDPYIYTHSHTHRSILSYYVHSHTHGHALRHTETLIYTHLHTYKREGTWERVEQFGRSVEQIGDDNS